MDLSDLTKKGVFYARQEFKRVTDGMASERFHPDIKYTTYRGVQIAEYIPPLHSVGLRHVLPTSLRPGYANFSERMAYQEQQGGSSQMEGIEQNGEWQHISSPQQNVYVDDPDRTHEHPDPRRHGYGGHWKWEPDTQVEEQGGAPLNPHGDGPKEGLVEGRLEEASGESNNSELVDHDKPKPDDYYTNNSATVGDPTDFEQIDSNYLNPMNLSKKPPTGQGAVERGPSGSSARMNDMQVEISALHETLKVLQDTLDMQTRESNREKNELKGKLGQYIRKTQQLNQIIIKNANKTNEPSDTEIERATTDICSDITSLIRTHYSGSKLNVNMSKAKQWKDEAFYKSFKDKAPETKRRLLSNRLFSLLNTGIFSAKLYGLDSDAEYHLENFERAILASPKINRQDADEWRVRTVSCASQLNLPLDDKVTEMLKWIWQHFCPMELSGPNKDTPVGINDIKVALRDLCEKSIKLALKFRATETRYAFQVPSQSAFLGQYPSENYRIMGTEGELSPDVEEDPKRQRVYCVLFGTLTKTRPATATDEEKTVVLFPAHVITYEDERDRDRERRDREQREREQKRRT